MKKDASLADFVRFWAGGVGGTKSPA